MKKLIYTNPISGGVSIVYPAPKSDLEKLFGPMTEQQYEDHVISRSIPEGVSYKFIEDIDIPKDREFRNAWKPYYGKIKEDLVKAKDIQLERIRLARSAKLEALDKEMLFAIEESDELKKASVLAQKNVYRNITEPLKALVPSNIQEIKDAFPSELK